MTLYSYMSYMFSPAAQQSDAGAGYAPLPTSWWDVLRTGFQTDY
jgi:hypothetical protein